ncbi:MAG: AarF/ABC1/UbiB kinase family protein [Atribacterota bacterium]
MTLFNRSLVRNLKRLRQILRTFTHYGFAFLFYRLPFWERWGVRILKEARQRPPQENLRLALEELGTTFIKIGQILSTRPDLLPEEYCSELRKLQDQAPPVSFGSVRAVVEKELKKPLEEVFERFDEKPLASASIAQVHRAKLHGGPQVAVKVQKEGVEEMVHSDLEILTYLAQFMDRFNPSGEPVRASEMVAEFKKYLLREIDFLYEASNACKFGHNFAQFQGVQIPRVFAEYSTKRVLTMELMEGIRLSQRENIPNEVDCTRLAETGVRAIFKMIFEDGFYHADPHPGNLLVLPETQELVFLDFGMVGVVDERTRENMLAILSAILKKDVERVMELLEEEFLLTPFPSPLHFRLDLAELLERYVFVDLREINLQSLFADFFYLLRRYRLRFPSHFSLLLRALAVAEGTGLYLDPHFTVVPHLKAFLEKTFAQYFTWDELSHKITDYALEWRRLLEEFPRRSRELLVQVSKGKIRLHWESEELKELNRHLEQTTNRLSLSIILGSLLIGSSLIFINYSHLRSLSILGILGYGIAAFLGVVLVIEILSHH